MSGIDLHDPAERKVLMDSTVEAAAAFLNAAIGEEPILFGKLWYDEPPWRHGLLLRLRQRVGP